MRTSHPYLPVTGIRRRFVWNRRTAGGEQLIYREFLVGNGLGGYASGTLAGVCTRRYHGLLVAALPVPMGRVNMLSRCTEELVFDGGRAVRLDGEEPEEGRLLLPGTPLLEYFELRGGLPVWRYRYRDYVVEKSLIMPHRQNTVHLSYYLLEGPRPVEIRLQPFMHFRPQAQEVSCDLNQPYRVEANGHSFKVKAPAGYPDLRLLLHGEQRSFNLTGGAFADAFYRVEKQRGYFAHDRLWTPGHFSACLGPEETVVLVASVEDWDTLRALTPPQAQQAEQVRRQQLVDDAPVCAQAQPAVHLVLASDQFVITPSTRTADAVRAHARGDELRSVIAGYHWFTDWGRDTMISLEGLTLATGRYTEAGYILRTFASYVRDGLIPNMFPEGRNEGVYHTSDATLWFFHAADRYLHTTGDPTTRRLLLPVLREIIQNHIRGTRFGIGVDPADGLLRQGTADLPLTWMDAKAGDWVVTPRRGKAVEINALWFNALNIYAQWLAGCAPNAERDEIVTLIAKVRRSFNRRFWNAELGYLYDVVDGDRGNDAALRPNQIFALALPYPVLERRYWSSVFAAVRRHLETPAGLRTLAPGHPDYQRRYAGDVLARDAAYHQGTVWPWLAGLYVDSWLRVHPHERSRARRYIEQIMTHLDDTCIGSISEVFDAEPPFLPKGCVSQAWSVAEVLRAWIKVSEGDPGGSCPEKDV